MSQSYINQQIDVISTHQKNQQNQLSLWKTANYQQRRHDPLSAAGSGLEVGVG
jgi:hypothetical protein